MTALPEPIPQHSENLLMIEYRTGTNIPTVRNLAERVGGRLILINPHEPVLNNARWIGLAIGAAAGIDQLYRQLVT